MTNRMRLVAIVLMLAGAGVAQEKAPAQPQQAPAQTSENDSNRVYPIGKGIKPPEPLPGDSSTMPPNVKGATRKGKVLLEAVVGLKGQV